MTDRNLTHIYVLLDRSGSMESIKTDIEGGYAAFVDEQRSAAGESCVTLAQFDTEYEVVYADQPVADIGPLVLRPRGNTALLDSMARLIVDSGRHLAELPEEQRPGTVIVAIMTDGLENSSREWTHAAVKELVERQTTAYAWQFLYMGADQDAIEVGSQMGIPAAQSVTYGRGKSREMMASVSGKLANSRRVALRTGVGKLEEFTPQERIDLAE
ncbi:MAG: VWA domain-containing protein [Candidatus Limnocylindria bacterium]